MVQIYSTEILLSYLYDEVCNSVKEEIQHLLNTDHLLRQRLIDLMEKLDLMKHIPLKSPSESVVNYVKKYAARSVNNPCD
ncbi:hypothetical protein [Rhizosphaericola mali]|uniref:Uncharacterized protein n=1 Tax=Rhizosphaericola mali TaxID=2545455 RepID=A0A5P2G4M3_9BACT|nr:hypothetical protein [Rhizosphaericola mali]QES90137.1 hypothetical protein E0W69_016275 [Rhizosphaericola mali]